MNLVAEDLHYVWKSRSGSHQGLAAFSGNLVSGEVHYICGATGSGKSTLGLALAGLVDLERGSVWLDDQPLSSQKHRVAATFQFPENIFFEDSVQRELESWLSSGDPVDLSVFSRLGIDFTAIAPLHPFQLSAGMSRMTAIALQLCRKPDVLILDEPTAGLDWRFHRRLIDFLQEWLLPERLLIMITHDADLLRDWPGTAWILQEGRLVWSGRTEILLNDSARLQQVGLE
jgi:energy-coupling factor transport system ATP-binding protein